MNIHGDKVKLRCGVYNVCVGPGQYDPRMKTEKGNLMTVHVDRFPKPVDDGVPGPGSYTVSICIPYRVIA